MITIIIPNWELKFQSTSPQGPGVTPEEGQWQTGAIMTYGYSGSQ